MQDDDGNPLYRAPSNAVRGPYGTDRKDGHPGRYLVLCRLVWPSRTEIRPAWVEWTSSDRALVVWTPRAGGRERRTWLMKEDVRPRLVY